jgi:hypothetical protein
VRWGVDFRSQGVVNNNFPVTPVMYRKGESELALLKGMEVKLHPLMAGAWAELDLWMVRWRMRRKY